MFMDDELATVRLRGTRISISFLIAITSFAALVVIIVGLLSAARAEETPQPQKIEQIAASGAAPATVSIAPVSAKPPRVAKDADEQIMSGLTMLLLALTGASALAVWRRRIKGLMTARVR
jgi:putative effector of murein hydrolase